MPSTPSEDLPESTVVFLLGMVAPCVVAWLFHDLLALYLDGGQFIAIAGVAFALVAWWFVETWDPDRPNFLVAAVLTPGLAFLLIFGYGMATRGAGPAFAFLFADGGLVAYPAAFGVAGFVAVALSRKFRSLAAERERVPEPRVVLGAIGLVVVVAVLGLLVVNFATASTVSVTSVDPGTKGFRAPSLNVTVAGGPAEVRVTAVAPDGSSVTRRLSRAEMDGGRGTVTYRIWPDDSSPPTTLPATSGTYRVRVTNVVGVPVDTATFEAEQGRAVAITDRTAAVGRLTWNGSAPERVYERYHYETKVGVVVENRGTFHEEFAATLETPEAMDDIRARSVFLAPGERVGIAFGIPDDVVEAVEADYNGTVTVTVVQPTTGEVVATADIELPEP